MFFGSFILFALILSLFFVHFGILAFHIFWRFILPILLVLFVIHLVISGILLLFNPYFWLLILVIAGVIWWMNPLKR